MITNNGITLKNLPIILGGVFLVIDLLSVIFLNIYTNSAYFEAVTPIWNDVHGPIRTLVEPFIFPKVTSHPLSITSIDMMLYYFFCILQSALLGFGIGWLIRFVMSDKSGDKRKQAK